MTVASYGEIMGVFSSSTQPLKYTNSVDFKIAGAECNTLMGLSKLGMDTTLLTAVGLDAVGNAILQKMAAERLNLNDVHQLAHHTTGIMIKEKGIGAKINIDYFRKSSAINYLDIGSFFKSFVESASYIYLTGVTPALSHMTYLNTIKLIKETKKQKKLFVFDPNYRKKLWDTEEFKKFYKSIEDSIDVLLVGAKEAEILYGSSDKSDIITYAFNAGISTIVIKYGDRGACFANKDETLTYDAYTVNAIDAVGAGDAFAAGFLYGMEKHTIQDLKLIAPYALAMGALATTSYSDYEGLPNEQQLENFINFTNTDIER